MVHDKPSCDSTRHIKQSLDSDKISVNQPCKLSAPSLKTPQNLPPILSKFFENLLQDMAHHDHHGLMDCFAMDMWLSLSLSLSLLLYIYIYTDIYRHILEAHHTFKLQTGRYGQLMDSSANESVTSRDASTLLQDQYDKSCWLLWDVGTHYLDMLGDYIWRSNLLGYIILSIEQTRWDETSPAWTHHGAHSQGRKIPSSLAFRQIRTQTHTTERRATMVLSTLALA